jgi:hypothetical protein
MKRGGEPGARLVQALSGAPGEDVEASSTCRLWQAVIEAVSARFICRVAISVSSPGTRPRTQVRRSVRSWSPKAWAACARAGDCALKAVVQRHGVALALDVVEQNGGL